MTSSGGFRKDWFDFLRPGNDTNIGTPETAGGYLETLLGWDSDVPFALALAQPGDECALQVAVIVFTLVRFNQLSFEQFLVRMVAGVQILVDRNHCDSRHWAFCFNYGRVTEQIEMPPRGIEKPKKAIAAVRDAAFRRVVASIPRGKVATYGQVAAAAGYPLYHRAVARFLQSEPTNRLPWQRVVGAGGEIKLPAEGGAEQRLRLRMEGVAFRGRKVNLRLHQYVFSDMVL